MGPVVSLKLIQDPSTGKPRGFGFCEYEDAETAMSACRNLAGRELNGRPLRIDSAMNAPGENLRGSMNTPSGPMEPPVHGAPVPPENAPEAITKAVASLPPEQMFELMKQMKWCIQHTPNETRQLLLHNPQLAYALLQAQVVMKIVDLDTAQKLLHRGARGQPLQSDPHPHPPPPPPPQPIRGDPPHQHPPPPPPNASKYSQPQGGRGGGGGWYREMPPRSSRGPPPPQHGIHPHDMPQPHHRVPPPGRGPDDFHRGPPPPPDAPLDSQDQEKAALLMQVLSLSKEQIQMLPTEQRNNILRLKEQIAHNRP